MTGDQHPPKRPRGRPRKLPGEPPTPGSEAVRAASRKGLAVRWGGRGPSSTIRVDKDAAEALAAIPERDRRRVASDAVRSAVHEYMAR